eukprot:Nitzschia sp. Nitz4//scaffold14_size191712//87118//89531//NITZ4_001719-RA/size191712-snap-gene-0.152-mRNA-1//-1//CDS//3329536915//298//frame0
MEPNRNGSTNKMPVLLPGTEDVDSTNNSDTSSSNKYLLQAWKVTPGTLVQKGETIAVAVQSNSATSTESSSGPSPVVAPAATSFKRPNRRRRPGAAAAPATPIPSAAPLHPPKDSASTLLHQRITEKLTTESSRKPTTQTSTTVTDNSAKQESDSIPIRAPATGILKVPESTQLQGRVVGYIEECQHPAFLEGICVVCGTSITKTENGEAAEGTNTLEAPIPEDVTQPVAKLSQVTVSGGITMTVSEKEGRNIAQTDQERLYRQAKLSLVLDLDHTLVHATADPRAQQYRDMDDVRVLRLPALEGMPNGEAAVAAPPVIPYMQHYVKLRPHIKTFLESVQKDFELTVYTAGTRHYAEEITIVLCRHLVGSNRDEDTLERMRYNLHVAELEFQKLQLLSQEGIDSKGDNTSNATEAQDSTGGDENFQPPKKRMKVSFCPPEDTVSEEGDVPQEKLPPRSDHITKKQLDALRKGVSEAEELEKEAWDLRRRLFGSRVVSRTDVGDLGRDVKSLKRIFPCGGTMAAVVDDREDVWANATDNAAGTIKGEPPDNLLLVRPYHWQPFLGYADVNNSAGVDLSGKDPGSSEGDDPRNEKDVQLVWTSRILKGLHRRYYRQDEDNRKTVPEILAQMRTNVLKDAKIVLSGLVPLHKQKPAANEARHPVLRFVQNLGAQLTDRVEAGVTHVVAAKDGTDKCLAARKVPGCMLVKGTWLVECYWSMTRRDPRQHLLAEGKENPVPAAKKETVVEIRNNTTDDSDVSDSDDNDLAAEFENEMFESSD